MLARPWGPRPLLPHSPQLPPSPLLSLPLFIAVIAAFSLASQRPAEAHPTESAFRLNLPQGEVHGTVLIPHVDRRIPCVVLIGGSLSHDRNGRIFPAGAPPRDALQRLAEALQAGGYGSIRYDRIGYGQSKPGSEWKGTYADEAAVAAAVIQQARKSRDFSQILVAGESAGAYVACLAAKSGTAADGYLFLGALCGPAESLYAYNFGRLAEFAASSPERQAWAESKARYQLALGRHYRPMLAAAAAGQDEYRADDQGYSLVVGGLARRREELADPPDELFRVLKAPVLALAGAADRNVPPDDAARIVAILREAGNEQATSCVIEGVDHSFQRIPASEDEQVRERFELTSFRRPYEAKVYHALLDWLYEHFPTPAEGYPERVEQVAARPTAADSPPAAAAESGEEPSAVRAADGPETAPKAADTPKRYIQGHPGP
jgi:pimeloyl-ACP methyl ester carboxylesterase